MPRLSKKLSKYPRCGASGTFIEFTSTDCVLCNKPATSYIWVEYWFMRSDDEKYHTCDTHLNLCRADTKAFVQLLSNQQE